MKKIAKNFLINSGFTLVELLVVISIIGILAGVLLPNLLGVRERARDSKVKGSLYQMKSGLRLYYNDYQTYPTNNVSNQMMACGPYTSPSDTACSTSITTTGANGVTYMKEILENLVYLQTDNGDAFEVYVILENESDSEIANSVTACGISSPVASAYYVCN